MTAADRHPGSARRLRITGDDFGASLEANEAIEHCARKGVLTHASLMVGAPHFEDAVRRARALPELAVGLHLVVCDGRALSPGRAIPDIVEPGSEDHDGGAQFPKDSARVGPRLWWRRRRASGQLEREIDAQLERFEATGLPLAHIDGHHHLHQHPVVFAALRRAMSGRRPCRVRLVHEDRIGRDPRARRIEGLVPAVHGALARWHRRRANESELEIDAEERVYGLRASGRVDETTLLWLIPKLCAPRVEIYSHPGSGPRGAEERDALCSEAVREAIDASPYELARAPRA